MEDIKFYDVNSNYTDFLRRYEDKVPHIAYEGKEKFLCGVVLNINSCNYYVPVSSFNIKQFTNFPVCHNGKIIATIRFSYMFPAPMNVLTEKNFFLENDDKYRDLLLNEWNYCVKHGKEIKNKAAYIYRRYIGGKDDILLQHSCNFPLLEQKMKEFNSGNCGAS